MYTLRIVFEDKTEQNINLGNSYRVISYETKQFKEILENHSYKDSDLYKFIVAQDSAEYPLFINNKNYIVSENGSTFAKL